MKNKWTWSKHPSTSVIRGLRVLRQLEARGYVVIARRQSSCSMKKTVESAFKYYYLEVQHTGRISRRYVCYTNKGGLIT